MNSKLDELNQQYNRALTTAADTPPATLVLDENWKALIEVSRKLCQEQVKMIGILSQVMTAKDMNHCLEMMQSEQAETVRTCRSIQQETAQEMQTAAGHLRTEADTLCKQAGRLNEQFSLVLKELDSCKHRLMHRTIQAVLISQVLLLILSAGLQLWLR